MAPTYVRSKLLLAGPMLGVGTRMLFGIRITGAAGPRLVPWGPPGPKAWRPFKAYDADLWEDSSDEQCLE